MNLNVPIGVRLVLQRVACTSQESGNQFRKRAGYLARQYFVSQRVLRHMHTCLQQSCISYDDVSSIIGATLYVLMAL